MLLEAMSDFEVLWPVAAVAVTALVVMVADWFLPEDDVRPPAALAMIGLAVAGFLAIRMWVPGSEIAFALGPGASGAAGTEIGLVRQDAFGLFASLALVLLAFVTVLISVGYVGRRDFARAEYFVLILMATAGMMLFVVANDLVLLFLALETFSIALYVLCAFARGERRSMESALKYFVLGAVAAAFLLYGIALVYAATGTTNLDALGAIIAAQVNSLPGIAYVGFGLILAGLGFKIAMVPFHQWTPDVYEGAPTTVTAFMAAATKLAAFVVLIRVLWTAFPAIAPTWTALLGGLAVVTMLVGNLAALVQSDLKRMLGYSAIAQAGYILVAVVVGTPEGNAAALYYLVVYGLMNLGAFGVLVALGSADGEDRDATRLDDVRGLSRRHPGLALALTVFLVSLTGLPPTAGFLGKWTIFQASIGAGETLLAVAVVLNSALSAFYYLRPVAYMYMAEPTDDREIEIDTPNAIAVATTALVVSLALVLSAPLLSGARRASEVGAVKAPAADVSDEVPLIFVAPDFEKGPKRDP